MVRTPIFVGWDFIAESLDFSAKGTDMFKSGFFTGLTSFPFSLFSTSGLNFAFAISAGDW